MFQHMYIISTYFREYSKYVSTSTLLSTAGHSCLASLVIYQVHTVAELFGHESGVEQIR